MTNVLKEWLNTLFLVVTVRYWMCVENVVYQEIVTARYSV